MFSVRASSELFVDCGSFGNFQVSFVVVLDLAKYIKYCSGAWCEMASFILKNKSEKFLRHESNGCSGWAGAAEGTCRHPPAPAALQALPARLLAPPQKERASGSQCGACAQLGGARKPWTGRQVGWTKRLQWERSPSHSARASPRAVALPRSPLFPLPSSSFLCSGSSDDLSTLSPFYWVFHTRTQENAVNLPTKLRGRERMTSKVK